MNELKTHVEDDNHTVYFTGFPWLYTSVLRYVPEVRQVFVVTCAALSFLLWNYFRTWTGVWVPIFSGILSSVWALGLVPLLGFNLDPLVLVVPIFLSARALSHSVQSMDRYHEEYHRTGDRHTAIVESYSHLFPPAIASILTDAAGIFLVTMAPIPLIQKVAIFSCFWIFSILDQRGDAAPDHPLGDQPAGRAEHAPPRGCASARAAALADPRRRRLRRVVASQAAYDLMGPSSARGHARCSAVALYRWHEQIYQRHHRRRSSPPARAGGAGSGVGAHDRRSSSSARIFGWRLKVGDMTPGAALLFPDHPYNVAYAKLNEKFLGANQLVVIADTGKPDGMKDVEPLTTMEEFADHMEAAEGAGVSVTVIDIVKQLSRLFHEGEPKWGFIPDKQKYIAELFYQFTQTGAGRRPRPLPVARHALRHRRDALPRLLARHHHERDQHGQGVGRDSTATSTSSSSSPAASSACSPR